MDLRESGFFDKLILNDGSVFNYIKNVGNGLHAVEGFFERSYRVIYLKDDGISYNNCEKYVTKIIKHE